MSRLFVAMVLLAAGCVEHRPETPEYFERRTGIRLCPGTLVRNFDLDGAAQAGTGFVYQVELRMDPACEEQFRRQVEGRRLPSDDTMHVAKHGDTILFSYVG